MAQQVKLTLVMLASDIGVLVQVLPGPLQSQLPAKAPREVSRGWHMGNPDEDPGSWLQVGPALASGPIWGREPADGKSPSLPVSLCYCLSGKFKRKRLMVCLWESRHGASSAIQNNRWIHSKK